MSSIKEIALEKQRVGGFLRPALFKVEQFDDDKQPYIRTRKLYSTISCLTKLALGNREQEVLLNAKQAALRAAKRGDNSTSDTINELLGTVDVLSDDSLNAISKLVALSDLFETCPDIHIVYNGLSWLEAITISGEYAVDADGMRRPCERSVRAEVPEREDKTSLRIYVERCLSFFSGHAKAVKAGFQFGDGYFGRLSSGEGDILTSDTIWTIETFQQKLTSRHTFRAMLNWMLACHSSDADLNGVLELGIFNPVINASYSLRGSDIPLDTIREVQELVCDN